MKANPDFEDLGSISVWHRGGNGAITLVDFLLLGAPIFSVTWKRPRPTLLSLLSERDCLLNGIMTWNSISCLEKKCKVVQICATMKRYE